MKTIMPAGSRLTKQRQMILETVHSAHVHPTAEDIYRRVKRQMPRISQATVYRNLDYLSVHGFIRRLEIPGEPTRFDGETGCHCHFICRDNRCIYDIPVDPEKFKALFDRCGPIENIDDFNIVIYGRVKKGAGERRMRKGKLK